jgi:murein DD-endopeptidase MepM/ murein hydrolase activator NlpD
VDCHRPHNMNFFIVLLLSTVAAKECVRVNSPGLSFRDGAGVNYNKIGEWNAGDIAEKIGGPFAGGDYQWLKLRNDAGREGFSASNWLQPVGCPSSSPPPQGSGGCAPGSSSANNGGEFQSLPADGLNSGRITQPYGRTAFSWSACASWYKAAGCMHNGIDIGIGWGTNVKAVCSGPVTSSTDLGGGNPMSAGPKSVVQHCDNWLVLYGHMSRTGPTGYKNAGDIVGQSGNPGGCSGCGNDHLHLEVRLKNSGSTTYSNTAVNPLPLFRGDLRGNMDGGRDIVCGNAMNQPDVVYGNAAQCKQWCGCPGKC